MHNAPKLSTFVFSNRFLNALARLISICSIVCLFKVRPSLNGLDIISQITQLASFRGAREPKWDTNGNEVVPSLNRCKVTPSPKSNPCMISLHHKKTSLAFMARYKHSLCPPERYCARLIRKIITLQCPIKKTLSDGKIRHRTVRLIYTNYF